MSSPPSLGILAPDADFGTRSDTRTFLVGNARFCNLVLWFLILSAIAYVILFLTKPTFVRRVTAAGVVSDEVDQARLIITSLVIGLVLAAVLYLLQVIR